jgi:hypothetical protein
MSHVHPIQEKKITIKAFKKLKSIVYKLQIILLPAPVTTLLTIIFLESIFRAFLLYLLPILFTNFI